MGSPKDLAAAFEIKIDGAKLSDKEAATLLRVSVERGIHLPDKIEIVLADLGKVWSEGKKTKLGSEIEVSLGHIQSGLVPVGKAAVASVETVLAQGGERSVKLVAYGPRYILQRGIKAKAFQDTSVDDAVKQTTGGPGASVTIDQGSLSRPYVISANVPGKGLLVEWAARLGLVVLEDGSQVKAKPPEFSDGPSFEYGQDLRSFKVEVNTFNQVSKVKVTSADPKKKEQFVGEAGPSKALDLLGGSTSGAKAAEKAFGEVVLEVSDTPVRSKGEAEKLAAALFNDRLFSFVTGFGTAKGNPKVKAGGTVTLKKIGKKLSGKYYVTRVVHEFAVKEGYITVFDACRPSIGG